MPARKRPPARPRRALAIAAAALLLVATACGFELLVRFPSAPGPGGGANVAVEIPKGVGPRRLAELIGRAGATAGPRRFALWLRAARAMPSVRTGRFTLRDDMTPREILDVLAHGEEGRGTRVTIPEGFDLGRTAAAVAAAGICSADRFLGAAREPGLLLELGIPGGTAEGFLFPDTYFLSAADGAAGAIRRMHATFERRYRALAPPGAADLLGTVTLASIVQAEAKLADEMPIIAAVYRNRLSRPDFPSRLLQADPTVAYGCARFLSPKAPSCARFRGTLGREQLDDAGNPYNTYRHPGLPPGPICAPGAAALEAALHPAGAPFLYFVAGPDGRHRFSETLEEHQRNVGLYRNGI